MKEYEYHRYANIVPRMNDSEFEELKVDISEIHDKLNEKNLTSSQKAAFAIDIQKALENQQYERLETIKSQIESLNGANVKKSNKYTNVYFIQSIIGGPVKIGRSKYPYVRLEEIQRMSPFSLEIIYLIENVHIQTEETLHQRFKKYHLHDEWFESKVLDLLEGYDE